MRKLLTYLDNNILKWGVIFASLFIVLYPKLPSIHITHTWVYIRLEDFVIGFIVFLWFVQVIRKKAKVPFVLGLPIILYWIIGAASLIFSLLYIGPHLTNFFPSIATLEYLRRIEYMILFFVGYGSITSTKDLKDFVRFLFIAIGVIVLYGLGQHFYPYFWKYLPEVIQKTNFCFPSFQTGNEEFAKGIPLCLPVGSRVTSTFGGHYDLAGYLLVTLPIVLGTWMIIKEKKKRVLLGILYVAGVITLILTSSRIAFGAYIFAVIPPLVLLKRKKWIVPVIALSFVCLVLFSESTIHRFAQTFRLTSVVVNMQGQIIGTTENGLSSEQIRELALKNKAIQSNQVIQGAIPEGSSFITLPQQRVATTTAVVKHNLTTKEAQQLQLANGGLQLSTVQGNFSVQKALVYDISVTTRLQGEWPHAIQSFLSHPLLGTGYSTLTLAVDNDFLRLLGESGFLGFLGFLSIFMVLWIFLKQVLPNVKDPLTKIFVYGLIGGIVGLFINAALFDIFEASKVAESLWLIVGVGLGSVSLYRKKEVKYVEALIKVATTRIFLFSYFVILVLGVFWSSINNFFIGDDFVWLKWAATSTFTDIPKYFTNAGGFFYRPVDKFLMLLFYSFFSFQPQGYHVVILVLHILMAIGVYDLTHLIFKRKLWAFLATTLFIVHPMHAENLYWVSALSIDLSSVCILFTTVLFLKTRLFGSWKAYLRYIGAIVLAAIALLSYELALVIPFVLIVGDIFLAKKLSWKRSLAYVPFIMLDVLYLLVRITSHAFGMGGDYSYNLLHFIPNTIGNIAGYLGLFLFGQWSLPYYSLLRTQSKLFVTPIVLGSIIIFAGLVWYLKKIKWEKTVHQYAVPLFGILFFLCALLPYIGLGNIAQRYGYLASVGLVVVVIWVIQSVHKKLSNNITALIVLGSLVTLAITSGGVVSLNRAQSDWTNASKITYNSLGYFKIEYPKLPPKSTFIIVHRPITYKDAWVFPVGLGDGLWFVYGDNTPDVKDTQSIQEAISIAKKIRNSYIFSFENNYSITKVSQYGK